jgi:hypothetical protein
MKQPDAVTLEPVTHTYTDSDGKKYPSVTQVIQSLVRFEMFGSTFYLDRVSGQVFNGDIVENTGKIGKAIHKGCFYLITGQGLNWDSLNPVLVEPLRQFEKWMQEWNPTLIMAEKGMLSKKYSYAGTPDIICTLPAFPKCVVQVDIKTGGYQWADVQLAAYEMLYRENYKYMGAVKNYVLSLQKDSNNYNFIPIDEKYTRENWRYFTNKLAEYKFIQKRGGNNVRTISSI